VDVREGVRGDPKSVWYQLTHPAHVSRLVRALGLSLQRSRCAEPTPAGRGGHKALEGRTLAGARKGALKEGRSILFVDQSGFDLLPTVVHTSAPVGQTPVLPEHLSRDYLSAISGITLEGKLL
jgi:hypothetical protein